MSNNRAVYPYLPARPAEQRPRTYTVAPLRQREQAIVGGWAEAMDRWSDGTGTYHAIRETVYAGNNDPNIDGKKVGTPVCGANLFSWGGSFPTSSLPSYAHCCPACVRALKARGQSKDIPPLVLRRS
jgi:hypothetical protein